MSSFELVACKRDGRGEVGLQETLTKSGGHLHIIQTDDDDDWWRRSGGKSSWYESSQHWEESEEEEQSVKKRRRRQIGLQWRG